MTSNYPVLRLLTFVVLFVFISCDGLSDVFISSSSDNMYSNHTVVYELYVRSTVECSHRCLQQENCVAYNMRQNKRNNCHLLINTYTTTALIQEQGATFAG